MSTSYFDVHIESSHFNEADPELAALVAELQETAQIDPAFKEDLREKIFAQFAKRKTGH
jgi:hypothetical protein